MDRRTLQKLADCDSIVPTSLGKWGVKVSMQYRQALPMNTFRETKRFLQAKFEELVTQNPSLTIDMERLSVSSLTVCGTLPVDGFDELRSLLENQQIHIRVRGRKPL
jgi:hypothetical protein